MLVLLFMYIRKCFEWVISIKRHTFSGQFLNLFLPSFLPSIFKVMCTITCLMSFFSYTVYSLQDYGIDFDDRTHPIRAFKCCCRSKFCRDMRNVSSKYTSFKYMKGKYFKYQLNNATRICESVPRRYFMLF